MIGGPRKAEQFVSRDDVFDCVTYCEVVLAAARAKSSADYELALRQIRYRDGAVAWRERNHYFADWSARNIGNGICRGIAIPSAETVNKRISYMPAYGAHRVLIDAVPRAGLLAYTELLATGDIVAFLSGRDRVDYFIPALSSLPTMANSGCAMPRKAAVACSTSRLCALWQATA